MALSAYDILDTAPEATFDRLTAIAASVLNAPAAMLNFLDEDTVWVKSVFGVPLAQVPREGAFCAHTVAQAEPFVVLDTHHDERFVGYTLVRDPPNVRFYAGLSLVSPEGVPIGTICVVDFVPRTEFSEQDTRALRSLADLALDLLEGRRRVGVQKRATERAVATTRLLASVAEAPGCDAAIASMASVLAAHLGAASAEMWRSAVPGGELSRVYPDSEGPPGERGGQRQAADGAGPGSFLEDVLVSDVPRQVAIAAVEGFEEDALVAAARAAGASELLLLPFSPGANAHVVVLGFRHAVPGLAAAWEEAGGLGEIIRPALRRKCDEERMGLLGSALDMAADGVIITEPDDHDSSGARIVYVNETLCRTSGFVEAELLGQSPNIFLGPDTDPDALLRLRAGMRAGLPTSTQLLNYRKDGSNVFTEMYLAPITGAHGQVTHFVNIVRDITLKLREERARQDVADSFRLLFDDNPLPMWIIDRITWRFLRVNQSAMDFYGWSAAQFCAMTLRDIRPAEEWPVLETNMSEHTIWMSCHRIATHRRADGTAVRMGFASRPHPPLGEDAVLVVLWDVTAVEATREELKRNNETLERLAEQLRARSDELIDAQRLAQLGSWRLSADLRAMTWSPEIHTLIGRPEADFPASLDNLMAVIYPGDRPAFEAARDAIPMDGVPRNLEVRIVRPDGRLRHARIEFRAVGQGAERHGLFGYVQDISDRWETEQAMMRSEKLALLGHLTGGVAHDFNNLLTVIVLNLEEAIGELPDADDLQAVLGPALQAAQRGAVLTTQLLAYARQAPLRPQPISLAGFFNSLSPMVRRALGTRYQLRIDVADHRCTPMVDASQLETAILNIALNARDAMPAGGRVTIAAARVTLPSPDYPTADLGPGTFAMISVADTGRGIPPATLPHIFEPFFTTKEPGKGSGLGLSMVHGFVGQTGGQVVVSSTEGEGTTVTLFLPLSAEQITTRHVAEPDAPSRRRALLVEDQPAVLATVSRMFTQLGYDVCGVQTAAAALAELDKGQDFAVLFTDIVLPGDMDGIALSRIVAERAPATQIVLTSGYSQHNVAQPGSLGDGILMKPYKRQELLDRLNGAVPVRVAT